VGGLAHRGACYVRDYGSVSKSAVPRMWLPPPRIVSRVGGAWGLVESCLCWEPVMGGFCARPSPGSC
jgi:hypothetical protein